VTFVRAVMGKVKKFESSRCLTPKGPRHFLAQKPLKIAMSAAFIQETKK